MQCADKNKNMDRLKLKASELRTITPSEKERSSIKKHPLYIVLDNVMDTYNVGAIFRLADALAAEKVILCGQTETPPNTRIKKASINTTEWVSWEYAQSAVEAIKNLQSQTPNLQSIAIEQSPKSVPFTTIEYKFPLVLVVGHETTGISQEVLDVVDHIAEIPMFGVNTSLNVMVSLGIVLYEVIKRY